MFIQECTEQQIQVNYLNVRKKEEEYLLDDVLDGINVDVVNVDSCLELKGKKTRVIKYKEKKKKQEETVFVSPKLYKPPSQHWSCESGLQVLAG